LALIPTSFHFFHLRTRRERRSLRPPFISLFCPARLFFFYVLVPFFFFASPPVPCIHRNQFSGTPFLLTKWSFSRSSRLSRVAFYSAVRFFGLPLYSCSSRAFSTTHSPEAELEFPPDFHRDQVRRDPTLSSPLFPPPTFPFLVAITLSVSPCLPWPRSWTLVSIPP